MFIYDLCTFQSFFLKKTKQRILNIYHNSLFFWKFILSLTIPAGTSTGTGGTMTGTGTGGTMTGTGTGGTMTGTGTGGTMTGTGTGSMSKYKVV